MCLYCKDVVETAEHTLLICPEWENAREVLLKTVKCRATLKEVVAAISENRTNWSAFNSYAMEVMLAKENLEREMERRIGEDEEEDLPPALTPPSPDPWPPPRRKVAQLEVITEDSESE